MQKMVENGRAESGGVKHGVFKRFWHRDSLPMHHTLKPEHHNDEIRTADET